MNMDGTRLFYTKLGSGKRNLLLFHGFGQDHSVFIPLAQTLSEKYTCYVFDLFFHGKSHWADDESPLEKAEWHKIIGQVIVENNLESFSMLGYSLGAKFAFATLESFPGKTNELFLVAPDGIKTSSWYSLATYPFVLRKSFKSMIHHQGRFLGLGRTLSSLGLLDKGLLRFAEQQMNTEEKRKRVYYSWVVFRHLKFDMRTLAELLNRDQIPVMIVVGKFDKVIKPENMNRLLKHLSVGQLKTIEAGHNHLLGKELSQFILTEPYDSQRKK